MDAQSDVDPGPVVLEMRQLLSTWGFRAGWLLSDHLSLWGRRQGLLLEGEDWSALSPYLHARLLLTEVTTRHLLPLLPGDCQPLVNFMHKENPVRLNVHSRRAHIPERALRTRVEVPTDAIFAVADQVFPWRARGMALLYSSCYRPRGIRQLAADRQLAFHEVRVAVEGTAATPEEVLLAAEILEHPEPGASWHDGALAGDVLSSASISDAIEMARELLV